MNLESPPDQAQKVSIPWRIYAFIGTVALLVALTMGYSLLIGNRMTTRYTPMIDAAMEIRLEATTAHLWLEEIISGDQYVDTATVWQHLDAAKWYANAMLEGGENPEGTFIPLEEPELHDKITEVLRLIKDFRVVAEERISAKEGAAPGTDVDQRFHALFTSFLQLSDEVETRLQQLIRADLRWFHRVQVILIFITLGLAVFAGFVLHRFERQRGKDFLALRRTSEHLEKEINKRKKTEEVVKKALETTETILQGMPIGVMVISRDKRIRRVNDTALRMMGAAREDVVGKICYQSMCPAQEGQCPVWDLGNPLDNSEKVLLDSSGTQIPILKTALPMVLDGEEVLLEAFVDITERKEAENRLKEYARKLASSNKALTRAIDEAENATHAKSEFLAKMSHELRTPLNSVIGFANVLLKNKNQTLQEKELDYLERIYTSGEVLLELINDVLDLSKIEAKKLALELSSVSLDKVVQDTLTQLEIQVRDKEVKLLAELPAEIKPFEADEFKLKEVLTNLLGNAIKFTEKGSITVAVITDPATHRPERIEVQDTGIGIPPDRLSLIFEAFQQVDSSTSRKYAGTGLGLTISRSLCDLMGYQLTVSSEEGKGSTFSIILTEGKVEQAAQA